MVFFQDILFFLFLVVMIGFIDDFYNLSSLQKFLWPFIVCILSISVGNISSLLPYYSMNFLISLIWLYGITNSVNFLDNMDGIATGFCSISSLFFGILALKTGNSELATISFIIFGSCLGFLLFNFPNAKCYLGDTGSLSLGFLLASIGISGTWSIGYSGMHAYMLALFIPLMVMGLTIYDTTYVVFSRLLNGKKPWIGDTNHTTHKLLKQKLSQKQVCFYIYVLCFLFSISSYFSINFEFVEFIILLIFQAIILLWLTFRLNTIPFEVK